jgi:hypothetical protein
MQEVFSKSTDPNVPLQEQECFELRIDDLIYGLGAVVCHRFLVREAHAVWSEIDRSVMWDGFEHDECSNLHDAELRYAIRRGAVVDKGFIYSDMES